MRIISKVHDYYDTALAFGRDETLVFARSETDGPKQLVKDVGAKFRETDYRYRFRSSIPGVTIPERGGYSPVIGRDAGVISATLRAIVVGFCGELYPAVMYRCIKSTAFIQETFTEVVYVENITDIGDAANDLLAVISSHTPNFARYHLHNKQTLFSRNKDTSSYEHRLLAEMSTFHQHKNSFENVFIEHRVPYFVVDLYDETVKFLPLLKDVQFYRVKDSFTAMQELSMYLGGVIPQQEKEIISISDKDRIAQHGFDKLSFRHPFK